LEKLSKHPHAVVFVEEGEELVGMGGIYFYNRKEVKHNVFLSGLYVKPNSRGRGIGRELIQARIDIASKNPSVKNILCEIFAPQSASVALHEDKELNV
jgi:L-amino acid N-acyltransferase YncA